MLTLFGNYFLLAISRKSFSLKHLFYLPSIYRDPISENKLVHTLFHVKSYMEAVRLLIWVFHFHRRNSAETSKLQKVGCFTVLWNHRSLSLLWEPGLVSCIRQESHSAFLLIAASLLSQPKKISKLHNGAFSPCLVVALKHHLMLYDNKINPSLHTMAQFNRNYRNYGMSFIYLMLGQLGSLTSHNAVAFLYLYLNPA